MPHNPKGRSAALFFMRFLLTGIALGSVVIITGLLELSTNAQTLSSTRIYLGQADGSFELIDIDWFTDLLDSIEQVPTRIDEDSEQSTDVEYPSDSPGSIEQAPTEVNGNSDFETNSLGAIEQAVHNQVNQYRASLGLAPLALDSRISSQARAHSQNMASGAVPFSHDGFSQRVQALATQIPYNESSENVAYNQGYADAATQAVQGWLNSTGHRTNIEGNYNLTGIGVAKNEEGEYYFTQIFVTSRIAL